ncbi:MAG: hypothetical protein KQA41_00535 [Candidatus Aenigmarchaeota archaeon]|nr:hypothetical protein [Candidatus Aenigmarchaeota archaeon]MBU5688704.1 hypothetical protein [Candidatus Aenigmarchaeota archaeon]
MKNNRRFLYGIISLVAFCGIFIAGYVTKYNKTPVSPTTVPTPIYQVVPESFMPEPSYQTALPESKKGLSILEQTLPEGCWPFAYYRGEDFLGPGGYGDWDGFKRLWDDINPEYTIKKFNDGLVKSGVKVNVPDTNGDGKVFCKK